MDERRAKQLVAEIEKRLADELSPHRPVLTVVETQPPTSPQPEAELIDRGWLLRGIRFLADQYQLGFLIDQETYEARGLSHLALDRLRALRNQMEDARERTLDGVSLEDAGFVKRMPNSR